MRKPRPCSCQCASLMCGGKQPFEVVPWRCLFDIFCKTSPGDRLKGPSDEPVLVTWAQRHAPKKQEMVKLTTPSGALPQVTSNHPVPRAVFFPYTVGKKTALGTG